MAYRRRRRFRPFRMKLRRRGRRTMRRRRKNLRRGTFVNRMYKKGVSRTLHTLAKSLRKNARGLDRKARRVARRR